MVLGLGLYLATCVHKEVTTIQNSLHPMLTAYAEMQMTTADWISDPNSIVGVAQAQTKIHPATKRAATPYKEN